MTARSQDTYEQWARYVAGRIVNGEDTPAAGNGTPPTLPGIPAASRQDRTTSVDRDTATINEVEHNLQTAVARTSTPIIRSPRSSVPAGFPFQQSDNTLYSDVDLEKQDEPAFEPETSDEPESSKKDQQSPEQEKGDEERDPNLIEWDGEDDPENPHNWKPRQKWLYTMVLGLMTFVVSFASSVFGTSVDVTSREFGVSPVVMLLGISLYVCGFATGPIISGPLSELYGRKIPLFAFYAVFVIFQIPVGVATNLQTIFVCRYFAGFAGAAPLAIVGGIIADYTGPVDRALHVAAYSGAVFIGPCAGPIVGGFITQSYLGWHWTAWITMIMASFFGLLALFIVPESFAPVLLQRRAKKIRYETRNWAIHAKADESQIDFKEIATKYLARPFQMLLFEPILLLVTLYMGFIYGILYLFFEAYPVTFEEQRGYNLGVGALPFIAILIGVLCGAVLIVTSTLTRFKRKFDEGGGKIAPEERLPPMILGGILLPAGLFWFAWTSSPHITPWPQIIAGIPIGAGIQMIFQQGLNYIIDVYLMHANSAIAANTIVRSFMAAGFPLFALGMYHNLGVPWATSLLGFLSAALAPVPVLFWIYGEKIRKMSRFSPTA